MLDPKWLRTNPAEVAEKLKKKGYELDVARLNELEAQRKSIQVETEELQNERNQRSKGIGQAKARGEDIAPLIAEMNEIGAKLDVASDKLKEIQSQLDDILAGVPNVPDQSVPEGKTEDDNVEVRRWGNIAEFDFEPKDHVDIAAALNGIDFEAAAKLTGSRFATMRGGIAKLHRALIQFMLDIQTGEHGYEELYVPYIVNADSLKGTGQLPKFGEDLFHLDGDQSRQIHIWLQVP